MSTKHTTVLAAFGAASMITAAHAGLVTVPGDVPTIGIAINLASNGDEIIVSPGTYFESINLQGKAITLRSSGGAAVTTIDAFGQFDSAIHCITGEGPDTIIEGFTLTRGETLGGGGDDRGAGLYCNLSSPTVRDCVFTANTATVGGAIYVNAGSPTFTDCRIEANDAARGGAFYLNNPSVTVTRCTVVQNSSTISGGAIYVVNGSLVIEGSSFIENETQENGGAIRTDDTLVTIRRSIFDGNFAGDGDAAGRGGALYVNGGDSATVENSLFVDNAVDRFGGALYAASPIIARNCTFDSNSGGGGQGLAAANGTTLVNCIATNVGDSPVFGGSVTYTNFEGGFAGTGNIDADPMFVDAANGDFRLRPGSPSIDAGNTTILSGMYPVDYDGNERAVNDPAVTDTGLAFLNLAVDQGAYELQVATTGGCLGDLDNSGDIGFGDLLIVLSGWGACP